AGMVTDVDPAPARDAPVSDEGRVRKEERRAVPYADRPAAAGRSVPGERHVRHADGAVLSSRIRRDVDGAATGADVAGEGDVEEGRAAGPDADGAPVVEVEVVYEPEVDEGEGAAVGDP